MNDSWVSLQGWVGTEVVLRETPTGDHVASFRLGCTPRFLRRGAWVDGQTSWYTVNAWRSLAEHVAGSVRKGDPVIVHGRIKVDVWQRAEGTEPSVRCVVEAGTIGHDLTKGTAVFKRAARPEQSSPEEDVRLKEMVHGEPASLSQLTNEGEPRSSAQPAA